MGIYQYKALTQDGREVSGALEYPEERSVLAWLEDQGYIPVDIELRKDSAAGPARLVAGLGREYRKFSIIDFTQGLGMLLRAGLPVDKALTSLIAATSEPGSRKLLQQVERDIREGSSLSKALRRFEDLFGRLYISLIQAGEISGNLDASIERLSEYLERQHQLRERIVNATIYPIILLVVTVFSIVILMTVVMPKFKQLFADMDAELPAITQAFLATSDFLQDYGSLLSALLLGGGAALYLLRRNAAFAAALDRNLLKLPLIGSLIKKIQIARYAETLSIMLKCGIPIQKSLGASSEVVSNSWIRQQLSASASEIKEGASFSSAIGKYFPALTQQMVKIGEQAGNLDQTLANISRVIQHDVNRSIQRIIGVFEPLIIVTLGVIVAAVIGSIMVAVLGMNDLISG
ncbi:MAG: type II secretion system F family protein [Gammaproteobacteria bacterium]|nr:type II secretion system F family protein [Gammaproteobacteria bacterium]